MLCKYSVYFSITRVRFLNFFFHLVHPRGYMTEEHAIALAEITAAVGEDARARTLAIAGKEPLTFAALIGEAIGFHATEARLLVTKHHLDQMFLVEIAQLVLGKDEMVAGLNIAIELHNACAYKRMRTTSRNRYRRH